MARICIVAEDDDIWGLSAWERTIPVLRASGHELVGIWRCPVALGGMRGREILLWYLRTFGLSDFAKLVLFALLAKLTCRLHALTGRRASSIAHLASKARVALHDCASPNDPGLAQWIKQQEVDVLLISVGFILKGDILDAPRLGIINKHAALLPGNGDSSRSSGRTWPRPHRAFHTTRSDAASTRAPFFTGRSRPTIEPYRPRSPSTCISMNVFPAR